MPITNVLGLSAFLDDPSAALLVDGRVVALAEEERFTRVKHGVASFTNQTITTNTLMSTFVDVDVRLFPRESIRFCLAQGGIAPGDLDFVALHLDLPGVLRQTERYARGFPGLPSRVLSRRLRAFRTYVRYLEKEFGHGKTKLRFVRHHAAHAAGAVFSSPNRRASFLTLDGMGEFDAGGLGVYNGSGFEWISRISLPHSIGRVYSALTRFLGFRMNRDEEQVMALAGYGRPRYLPVLEESVRSTLGGFRISPKTYWTRECQMGFRNPSPLPGILGIQRRMEGTAPLTSPYPDVAASLQELLYQITRHLCVHLLSRTGYRDLCLAGGVALNCDNNGLLLSTPGLLRSIWVQPQAGDAGGALGAAYWVYFKETGRRPAGMRHAYLGVGYGEEEIERALATTGMPFERTDDLPGEVAEDVARGHIVGWFQGREEAGPRALGARSILARADNRELCHRIGESVKHREAWRPFAPSILDDRASALLDTRARDRFMTVTVPVSDRGRVALSGTLHVTGRTRAQVVPSADHAPFYDLLRKVDRTIGIGAVLNTSFNDAGEPIVHRPEEALADFFRTGLDTLAMGPFLMRKRAASG